MAFDSEIGPDPVDIHVGARLRGRRKEQGLSQEALAHHLGLTFQQVQKYERGSNRVSASKLHACASMLGVPIGYFFEGLDDPVTGEPAAEGATDMARFAGRHGALELVHIVGRLDGRRWASLLNVAKALDPGPAHADADAEG